MQNIRIDKTEITLTETSIRQILKAIDEARELIELPGNAEPIDDNIVMTIPQYEKRLWSLGEIFVSSPGSKARFRIELETGEDSEGDWGYVLEKKNE
jgi:hypothetical protein